MPHIRIADDNNFEVDFIVHATWHKKSILFSHAGGPRGDGREVLEFNVELVVFDMLPHAHSSYSRDCSLASRQDNAALVLLDTFFYYYYYLLHFFFFKYFTVIGETLRLLQAKVKKLLHLYLAQLTILNSLNHLRNQIVASSITWSPGWNKNLFSWFSFLSQRFNVHWFNVQWLESMLTEPALVALLIAK